ncbi:hypothetical protein CEUSTIGMA_g8316.t1 [Chlamydomonas eustigma]|uniref:Mitochondrial import receptor subunit TOM20 n=1 Tax=Chlamydomonas eustigma TaxID=1157962 RepID=A0A250XCS9_9CHLO|nr:hypothetical protein CEUSTIGMA_g8316.t1 [Chlamydomonas eustigma]|eukprot:GAX80881.1 hypothetical protein CEUSTIGMA_g8316.t1 [Chlamydomonas eustigma]
MFGDDSDREQALVRWGGALLELAHFKQGQESIDMIQLAIVKLQQALSIDSERADAEWCLGNAYTSLGFLCSRKAEALEQFGKAADCFKRCNAKDPSSETYKKAMEMCEKAPDYYDEIQSHIQAQNMAAEVQSKQPAPSPSDFWWDMAGWFLLAGAIGGALLVARASAPTPKSS